VGGLYIFSKSHCESQNAHTFTWTAERILRIIIILNVLKIEILFFLVFGGIVGKMDNFSFI
jgi:hypothetical protein